MVSFISIGDILRLHKRYVPLPVHSIPGTEDFIVTDGPNCPRRHALHELVRQTPEFKKVVAEYKWMFDFLKEKTEQEWDPLDIWIFQDAFFIEANWKLLNYFYCFVENSQAKIGGLGRRE
jgi:hypothetical protein